MPFGLCNASATFQRLMAQASTKVTKKYGNLVMCYVDDVVIATPTLEDHIDRLKGKKVRMGEEAEAAFENMKRELCEAPVLGMPTEKGMYVLDTNASVVAISVKLHQEQKGNRRTVLRPIAYGSKLLSDTEMKYGAPKAEMFAVVTFVEKYRAYLRSAPFKLRVDNRALSWLKTYSMDQSCFGSWIEGLDGYHLIIEHRMRNKHQNADSLSKKTEFYEKLEQKQANQAEIK